MDSPQFDSPSIYDEFERIVEEMTAKQELNEDLDPERSAALLYAKQVTPNVFIDITDNDPILMKTEPDRNNFIENRRVAFENVPKKASQTLREPMKPLIHRKVGRIFSPANRRRHQKNVWRAEKAIELVRQLQNDSESTQYVDQREAESNTSTEQDQENEFPTIMNGSSTQVNSSMLNLHIFTNPVPVEPDLSSVQPIQPYYCSYCNKHFANQGGLTRHSKQTKIHAENVFKAHIRSMMVGNTQNGY